MSRTLCAAVLGMMVTAAACSSGHGGGAPTTTTTTTTTTLPAVMRVDSEQKLDPSLVLDPSDPGVAPAVDESDALRAAGTPVPGWPKPQVFYGRFTDANFVNYGPNGSLVIDHRLAWVFVYSNADLVVFYRGPGPRPAHQFGTAVEAVDAVTGESLGMWTY